MIVSVQNAEHEPTTSRDHLLYADVGRPDMTELSRVVGRAVAEAAGLLVCEYGPPGMREVTRTTNLPRGPVELVPGDIEGIHEAARALRAVDLTGDPASAAVAQQAADAHDRVARGLLPLRTAAEALFAQAREAGMGDDLLIEPELVREVVSEGGPTGQRIEELVREMSELRLRWDELQIDFFEDLTAARETLGIPSW